jgi:hypothetical protein
MYLIQVNSIPLRLLITTSVLCVAILSSCVRAISSSSVSLKDPDAYIIFNEALKEHAQQENALIVSIVRFTNLPDRAARCSMERTIDSTQLHSAVYDLRRKNASTYVIEPMFDVPFKYELVDKLEELGGNRAPPPGQDKLEFLREQIGKLKEQSQRQFTQVQMSVPGISDDGQVAIVYIAVYWAGGFRVLHKKGNMWIVEPKPVCPWIS